MNAVMTHHPMLTLIVALVLLLIIAVTAIHLAMCQQGPIIDAGLDRIDIPFDAETETAIAQTLAMVDEDVAR